jgi:hypothetical protein
MALTYELANPQSPVFQYLRRRCPIIDGTKRGAPLANELQKVLGFAWVPKMPIVESPVAPAGRNAVGTAFDYRVREYLGDFDVCDTVAARGSRLLEGVPPGKAALRLFEKFLDLHQSLIRRVSPVRRRLGQPDEDELSRHCIVLAYYEQIYRASPAIRSPLYELAPKAKVEDLLALPSAAAVQDVRQLIWGFDEDFQGRLDSVCVLNPKFAGSVPIGGADADFVLANTLFELKAISKFEASDLRETMYQLLGYTLLD